MRDPVSKNNVKCDQGSQSRQTSGHTLVGGGGYINTSVSQTVKLVSSPTLSILNTEPVGDIAGTPAVLSPRRLFMFTSGLEEPKVL